MHPRDLMAVQAWLRTSASLADVEAAQSTGVVGNTRHTEQAVRLFRLLWTWSAPRFTGDAGQQQDRFFTRCGSPALARRIQRCQHFISQFTH